MWPIEFPQIRNPHSEIRDFLSETEHWLELSEASGLGTEIDQQWLLQEANELIAIFTSIGKTSKART